MRSLLAVERADVCLLMIDANEGVTEQDTKIAGEAHEAGKEIIIVVNKWDAYEKDNGTLELAIGFLTPPVGVNLFVASGVAQARICLLYTSRCV